MQNAAIFAKVKMKFLLQLVEIYIKKLLLGWEDVAVTHPFTIQGFADGNLIVAKVFL